MKQKSRHLFIINVTFIFLIILTCSCVNTKKVAYFQNLKRSDRAKLEGTAVYKEPVIQSDDILSISIITVDPQTASVVNQSSDLESMGNARQPQGRPIEGFVVDKNGEIELAIVGTVKVAGLTIFEARELIRKRAAEYYRKPAVTVRFANFKVSVLGEVSRPGSFTIPGEKVTVLDALSLAGDLTLYGKRENIMVVRETDKGKEYGTLNIASSDFFNSPYYYLHQNDVVYVEPNKARVISLNGQTRTTVAVIISAISTIVLIITRIW